MTTLGQHCDISMGQAPSGDTYNEGAHGLPLIAGAGDFSSGAISVKKFTSRPTKISEPGDIVMSIRASIGDKVWADGNYCLGRGVVGLRPSSNLDRKFLWHWLTKAESMLRAKGKGATFLQVSRKDIADLPLRLPPMSDQRRIADILDKADALRAKRREAISKLDSLSQSIFHETFGNLGSGGRVALTEVLRGGLRNGLSPSTSGSVPGQVLTLSAITGHDLDLSQKKSGLFDSDFHADQRVQCGQMLFCRGNGNKKLVGVGKVVGKVQVDLGYPDTIIAGDINADVVEPAFLQSVWDGVDVRGQIERVARTTNGTFKVNQTTLGSITFPLPSLDLQREFASRIAAVEGLKAKHQAQLAELDNLFLSLQDRAFKGEL